jgi:hypothetical protein
MAAVDVDHAAPLLEQLRETVRRIVLTEPGARLACVSVMRTNRIGMDDLVDADRARAARQAAGGAEALGAAICKALKLDEGRLTFHVLEAPTRPLAIVEFAERNAGRPHRDGRARATRRCAATWAASARRWWPGQTAR